MTPDFLYAYFKQNPQKPYSLRELARRLKSPASEVHEVLKVLVADGRLVRTRRKTYGLPEEMNLLVGRVQVTLGGYGFVVADEEAAAKADLFVPPAHLGGAWNGDRVVARRRPPGQDDRPWGEILRVLERRRRRVVGRLEYRRGYAVLRPDDPKLPAQLPLAQEGLAVHPEGARLVVQIVYPEDSSEHEAYGELVDVLGEEDRPETEIRAVILRFGLAESFPPEVLETADRAAMPIAPEEVAQREDFRDRTVFTIDGADAKDFDDAIHIERLKNGSVVVGIHIADVAHYVPEGGVIDQEALEHGTSVYLPGRVLPMLPERLSNGVCSLMPGEDRLTLSVLITLSPEGQVLRYTFKEGLIRSMARLTYETVQTFFEEGELPDSVRLLGKDLSLLLELTQKLRQKRIESGALDFQITEVKAELSDDGELHLQPVREGLARNLIEELMLLANRVVAQHLSGRGIPALYRVHEDPIKERYAELRKALSRLGYELPGGDPDSKAMQEVLKSASGKPEAKAVSMLILRSLRLARYAEDNLGHFGLAFPDYLHFTSPIRRYPDLVVHRVLHAVIKRRFSKRKLAEWVERFPNIAQISSARERNAEAAERDLAKYFQCLWAKDHLHQVFNGSISGVISLGVFVMLENGVEGLLHVSNLGDDYYEYQEDSMVLRGRHTGRLRRLGDTLKVRIEAVNPPARQVDFALMTEARVEKKSEKTRDKRVLQEREGKVKADKKVRRVVGPPDERSRAERPVRVTIHRMYFGEWSSESSRAESQESTPPRPQHRRKRKQSTHTQK